MTAVYGFNTVELRKLLWYEPRFIEAQINTPWLIWVDFNALLQSQNRLNGHAVTRAEISDFATYMKDLFLTELPWRGEFYTCSNKQLGPHRICS